ncbi:MAG: hypothetical protein RL472_974 [Pseudomonadota bacterium]
MAGLVFVDRVMAVWRVYSESSFINGRPTSRDRTILSHIGFDILMETGAFVQAMPVPISRENSTFSFYTNVRTDGVPL